MFEDEPTPEKKVDLERFSVEDLRERIDELKAEIDLPLKMAILFLAIYHSSPRQ